MKNKLISLISIYKYFLIYLLLFAFISFIFNPRQKEYYLTKDIQTFQESHYLKIAVIGSVILICVMLTIGFLRKFKFHQILNTIVFTSFICFSVFLLMQNTITCFCLWVNRFDSKKEIIESYRTLSITDNKYFIAKNTKQPDDFIDQSDYFKYSGLKDASKLKRGDTLSLKFKQGLLGINYFEAE